MKLLVVVFTTLVVFVTLAVTIDEQSCRYCCSTFLVALNSSSFSCPSPKSSTNCTVTLNQLIDSSKRNQLLCGSYFAIQLGTHIAKHQSQSTFVYSKGSGDSLIIRGQAASTKVRCENNVSLTISAPNTTVDTLHFQNCKDIRIQKKKTNVRVVIVNSRFTNSCLTFKVKHTAKSEGHTLLVIVRNTTFDKSTCDNGILSFTARDKRDTITLRLQEVKVSDNNSPLLKQIGSTFKVQITVTFIGSNTFHCNKDFVLYAVDTKLLFVGADIEFINNSLKDVQGTPIYARDSVISFEDSRVKFNQNQGGIAVETSQILFKDNVTVNFTNNKGLNGGALSLYTGSTMVFNATKSNVTLYFINNTARLGGAIYVEDRGYSKVKSVFDLQGEDTLVKLWFQSNSALLGGNQIYGGWVDWFEDKSNGITDILQFSQNQYESTSKVASDPVRICLCHGNEHLIPDCNITNHTMNIYGCALNLDIVAVGQRFTPVIAYVEALASTESELQVSPRIESLRSACTRVKYTVDSLSEEKTLMLKPYLEDAMSSKFSESHILFQQLTVQLKRKKCSLGFVQKEDGCECVCQPSLTSNGFSCDMDNYNINVSKQQWVGVTHEHTTAGESSGVIAHQYCPFDYCKNNDTLSIHLPENQDEQCAFNRTGILCGGCKTKYSRVLGSSKCKKCLNNMLVVSILCSLVVGLILVIVLMALDLTVSVGTINGLIFYANIIRAQHATFFISATTFPSVFIAWLNLDLGIESCLFDGLDSYVETWLQFCFPLYIWIIVTVIIVSCHYSTRISKLCSKNIVQVLATLFLLSYTKLLRLVIDVVTFTRMKYPNGYVKAVWLYDGNIDHLRGKHIPLFIATLLLLGLLSVPYTLSLVSIQWLLKISHYRAMFWVEKLKPFFDAYTGPYRAGHRYWTGLLLLIRIVLLIMFSMTQSINPTHNLLAITVISFGLLTYFAGTKGVYKNKMHNYLEVIFLCNLGLTSAAVQYELANGSKHSAVPVSISTGVAIVFFVGIVLYHVQRQVFRTTLGLMLKQKITKLRMNLKKETPNDLQMQVPIISANVTSTVVEMKEPLLVTNS